MKNQKIQNEDAIPVMVEEGEILFQWANGFMTFHA